jgi:putative oxidoreductase
MRLGAAGFSLRPSIPRWEESRHEADDAVVRRFQPAAPLVLRVVLGGLFVYHGVDKFDGGIDTLEQMFDSWGVPAPGLTAPLTAIVEIVAGVALVVGLFTRLAASLLAIVMVGALLYVKTDLGIISTDPMPGAELDLALLAGFVTLMATGPGAASIDRAAGLESTATA